MSSRSTIICSLFSVVTFSVLGGVSSLHAVNEEDVNTVTSFPLAYEDLEEKSVYHQNNLRQIKSDLNDYGDEVHDLRRRFDRLFYDKDTNLPKAKKFEVGQKITLPTGDRSSRDRFDDYGTVRRPVRSDYPKPRSRNDQTPSPPVVISPQASVEKRPPSERPPLPKNDDRPNQPLASNARPQPEDENSPLAIIVKDSSTSDSGKTINFPVTAVESTKDSPSRKFDYYVLPRIGFAVPTEGDAEAGMSLAVAAGVIRGDWRYGVDFSYLSSEASFTENIIVGSTPFPHQGEYEHSAYSFLLNVTREIELPANWIGSIGFGVGGGWSVSEKTLLVKLNSVKDSGFAWQLGLGARRPFGDSTSIYLGYRYLGHPSVPSHNFEAGAEIDF